MTAMTIDIHDVPARLLELLPFIDSGNEVIVTQGEKPVVRLVQVEQGRSGRVPGLHAGMGWMSDDFDAPLSDDFWSGTE